MFVVSCRARIQGMFDIYNILNGNAVVASPRRIVMKGATLSLCTIAIAVGLAGAGTWLAAPTRAQGNGSGDWVSHNVDRQNTRYSPLDQINTSNVSKLRQQWSIQASSATGKSSSDAGISGTGIRQVTPLVIDGVMYFNAGHRLFAVDAATGASLWTREIDPPFSGSGRGPTYGDGYIYAFGGPYGASVLYAIDARSGQPLQSFGTKGRLMVAEEVVTGVGRGRVAARASVEH